MHPLQGEMAATAVNAPMMPAEVLKELQPFVTLASGLGRAAVQLVGDSGFSDITITYASPRGDDLDTRLLRAMVIKASPSPRRVALITEAQSKVASYCSQVATRRVEVPEYSSQFVLPCVLCIWFSLKYKHISSVTT